jgi:hypothetical protein
VAVDEKPADEVGADEPCGSGDQRAHEAPQSSSARAGGRLSTLSTMYGGRRLTSS